MFDLAKVDYFELFKQTLVIPEEKILLEKDSIKRQIFSNENEFGRIYSKTITNVPHLNEERILTGETNRVNFESEYFVHYSRYFRSTLKIYQYSPESIIRVRIALRYLECDSSQMNTRLFFRKKHSLSVQFNIHSKQFQYQVKFPKGKERNTYLSFNTANFIKSFVDNTKLSEFAIFFLKSSANEFILKSENIQFVESLFNNTGEGFVCYNLDNKKLSEITNPTILYRYITGYKNLNKNFLKLSIKKAAAISKFIREEDQHKFFEVLKEYNPPDDKTWANQEILNGLRNKESDIEEIVNYFKWTTCGDPETIRDYIAMAQQLEEKVNLNISSPRRLKEEHDRLVKKQRALRIPDINVDEKYKNVLASTETLEIELIDNKERLAEESDIMHHCVYSYYHQINNGTCAIFSIQLKKNLKERWTMELRAHRQERIPITYIDPDDVIRVEQQANLARYSYYIAQLRGYNNDSAPQWVRNEILNLLAARDPDNKAEAVETDYDEDGFYD